MAVTTDSSGNVYASGISIGNMREDPSLRNMSEDEMLASVGGGRPEKFPQGPPPNVDDWDYVPPNGQGGGNWWDFLGSFGQSFLHQGQAAAAPFAGVPGGTGGGLDPTVGGSRGNWWDFLGPVGQSFLHQGQAVTGGQPGGQPGTPSPFTGVPFATGGGLDPTLDQNQFPGPRGSMGMGAGSRQTGPGEEYSPEERDRILAAIENATLDYATQALPGESSFFQRRKIIGPDGVEMWSPFTQQLVEAYASRQNILQLAFKYQQDLARYEQEAELAKKSRDQERKEEADQWKRRLELDRQRLDENARQHTESMERLRQQGETAASARRQQMEAANRLYGLQQREMEQAEQRFTLSQQAETTRQKQQQDFQTELEKNRQDFQVSERELETTFQAEQNTLTRELQRDLSANEMQLARDLSEAEITARQTEGIRNRSMQRQLAQLGFTQAQLDRTSREVQSELDRGLQREGMEISKTLAEAGIEQQIADRASRLIIANMQIASAEKTAAIANPFGAFAAEMLGGVPGATTDAGTTAENPLLAGLSNLGFGVPEGAQAGQQTPASAFFGGQIPTLGSLAQIPAESLQTLMSILGFTGTGQGGFARQAGGVTPGTAGGPSPMAMFTGGPTGARG